MQEDTQGRIAGLDSVKLLCALAVVCIHRPLPGAFGITLDVACRVAVPLFFMITGYFYGCKIQPAQRIHRIKKVLGLVITANLIYFFEQVLLGMHNGQLFTLCFSVPNLVKWFVFNVSPLGCHIWYLKALLYTLCFLEIFQRRGLVQKLYVLIPLLLAGHLLAGTYCRVLLGVQLHNLVVRNFLFMGLPFVLLGHFIRTHTESGSFRQDPWVLRLVLAGGLALSLAERWALQSRGLVAADEVYLGTIFASAALFQLCLQAKGRTAAAKLLAHWGREYCSIIYVMHILVLDGIELFIPAASGLHSLWLWAAPAVGFSVSLLLAALWRPLRRDWTRRSLCASVQ